MRFSLRRRRDPVLRIGGRARRLRLTPRAIDLVRQETGVDLAADARQAFELPVTALETLLWAALTDDDHELDVDGEARKAAIRKVRRWAHERR